MTSRSKHSRAQLKTTDNADEQAKLKTEIEGQADATGEWQRQSVLGRMGQAIEPAVRPLGWDWRIGMAALASFPAREVVVGTLGIIYNEDTERCGKPTRAPNRGWG